MAQMNLSNTLWNDDSSGTIALVEQLKDRLLHTYIANNPNYSATDKSRIPADLKAELGIFQEKLNEFFLDHWVDFQRFLLDEGVDPTTIDSWKEVQEFLEGLPDDETMWLKNKLAALDTAIAGIDQDGIGIFDVSSYNNVGGAYATYNGLSAALAAVPTASKRSGMTIRYIDSTSNQYEEYRYFLQYEDTTAGNAAFNNTANWQGIDDEPTAGSENLVKSGGVYVQTSQLTQEVDILDDEINSKNKTVYENVGQVAYYEENGFPTGWYGTGTYTPIFTTDKVFNAVKFPPFKTGYSVSGETKYYIAYGNVEGVVNPEQNLTPIKEGIISAPLSFSDITIYLDDFITVPAGNKVYVFLYTYIPTSTSSQSLILGSGVAGQTSPEVFSQNDAVALLFTSGNITTPFNSTWSIATPGDTSRYRVCNPILLVNGVKSDINNIKTTILNLENDVSNIQDNIGDIQDDIYDIETNINSIVNDIDETEYENEGEWEYYEELNIWTGNWKGTGTSTVFLEDNIKINCICIPTFKLNGSSVSYDVKYFIGYRQYSSEISLKPSTVTLIKSGIISNVSSNTAVSNIKIYLDEPIIVPVGNQVIILLYSQSSGIYIFGGGNINTERLPYNNKVQPAFLTTSTDVWDNPFSINWYIATPPVDSDKWRVCSPILKLEESSIIGEKINEIVPPMLQEQVPVVVNEILEEDRHINVYLPNKLYAVVGDTLQIFFHGIVAAVDLEQYDIYALCDKGKTYPRYFSYTPTVDDIGTNTFSVYVRDRNGIILGSASCSLITVAAPVSPATIKSIFTFGDSLTSPGIWVGEAKRRLVGTSTYDYIKGKGLSNLSFFGYMSKTIHDQPVNYHGVGGWTWLNYITKASGGAFRFYVSGVNQLYIGDVYTNNGYSYTIQEINVTNGSGNIRCTTSSTTNIPNTSGTLTKTSGDGDATITFDSFETENMNPLWDDVNNKMSFIPYVQDCGANTIDAVYALLTWNGQSAWKEYSADDTTGHIANAKVFARTLHSEYPDAKLFIMGIQMPSDTGGLGANYGATGGYHDGYGLKQCALSYNKALQDLCNLDEFSSYCEFVATAPQFDTYYNMPFSMSRVNIRNSTTEMLGTNGVHPSEQGYNQIADAVYRSIVANYCQ